MAEENIKISKKLYSRSDVNNVIDLSFSELFEKDNRSTDVKIKNLFQEYNSLFYDIPKTGILSHSILFIQSRDYINDFYDPKDDQIEALLERIETLEDDLLEATNDINPEHPIYNDGTFVKVDGFGRKYFMYKGKACPLNTTAYDILAKKYYPYLFMEDFEGDKFEIVVEIDDSDGLPSRGQALEGGVDINNIDNLIQAYL